MIEYSLKIGGLVRMHKGLNDQDKWALSDGTFLWVALLWDLKRFRERAFTQAMSFHEWDETWIMLWVLGIRKSVYSFTDFEGEVFPLVWNCSRKNKIHQPQSREVSECIPALQSLCICGWFLLLAPTFHILKGHACFTFLDEIKARWGREHNLYFLF